MKQRVKLAQALVHDPRLLLLDEPTNGLDPAGRDEMLDLVRRTGTEFGMAVIVSSHLLGEIERVCDHVVAIDAGRLLRDAPLASFTTRTGTLVVELDEGADERRRGPRGGRGGRPAPTARGASWWRSSTSGRSTSSATPWRRAGSRSPAWSRRATGSRTSSATPAEGGARGDAA